jgi:hypothetical protein
MWNHKKRLWILDASAQDGAAERNAEDAKLLHEQQRLWLLLDEWEAPQPSVDFEAALYRRIDESERRPWLARCFESARIAYPNPALGFALVTLAVIAGLAVDHSRILRAHGPLPRNSAVSMIDADQLENSLDDLQLLHQIYADPGLAPQSM